MISFTIGEESEEILIRHYKVGLKKSGSRLPLVDLVEIGPAIDLKLRRTQWASEDLMKTATKQPKQLKVRRLLVSLTYLFIFLLANNLPTAPAEEGQEHRV